jgi:EAL and modified HD-GYP domain-containing signal transduction protein
MAGWFSKLMGREAVAQAPATVQAQAVVAARPPAPAPVAAAAPAPAAPVQYGQRKPLVGSKGSVAGFEVLMPANLEQRLVQRPDPAARAAHQALLLAAAASVCKAGRMAVLHIAAGTLVRPGVAQQAPAGALLCVDDLLQVPVDLAGMLRSRGVKLGVPDGPPASAPAADFVLLRAPTGGLDTLMLSAQRWRAARPKLPLVATGLQHLDDVERLLRSGFALAGGVLDRSAQAQTERPLSAAAHRICELLNHLSLDRDTAVVADAVRADVALSYRLLRYANSPAIGLRRSVEAVNDAVMLLGRQELYRWLSVLLLTVAESRQASRALQETALARGRLLESLARKREDSAPQTLFTIGMLSMMEVLLQTPLAQALGPLNLSEPVRQALLQGQGPYAEYLLLAQALDGDDPGQTDRLAQPFGGAEVVQSQAEEAWVWAQEMARGAAAED